MTKLKIAVIEDNYYDETVDSFFYKLIVAEVLSCELTPNEFLLMVYIINQTIGHRDKMSGKPKMWDFISQSIFQRLIGAKEETTARDLKSLESKGLISVYRNKAKRRENSTARFNAYRIGEDFFSEVYETFCELTGNVD